VGKDLLTESAKEDHGNYPALGKYIHTQIPGSKLVELTGVGHIPHIQEPEAFATAVFGFL
jgi:pimeloyl-ACP methyl ester carboxylesterase